MSNVSYLMQFLYHTFGFGLSEKKEEWNAVHSCT